MTGSGRRAGVSLLEVVVVVAILGVLFALVFTAVQKVRGSAARAGCANNLRQIGLALHAYHDANGGLPPRRPQRLTSREPDSLLSFFALILPQMGEEPLWRQAEAACAADPDTRTHAGYARVVRAYACPADGRLTAPLGTATKPPAAYGSYLGSMGSLPDRPGRQLLNGAFCQRPGLDLNGFRDGLSQTLMVGERPPPDSLQAGEWYPTGLLVRGGTTSGPNELLTIPPLVLGLDDCPSADGRFRAGTTAAPCDRKHYWSLHPGGGHFLMADGAVRFFPYTAADTLRALATRDGGEVGVLPD